MCYDFAPMRPGTPWFLAVCLVAACACRNEAQTAPTERSESVAAPSTAAPTPPSSVAPPSPAPASSTAPAEKPFEGTAGIIEEKREAQESTELVAVREARHDGFDRVVFEFRDRVPGYHVEYIDRPVRKCGSGDPTAVAGDGWLEVRMYPVNAHDEQGRPLVANRERAVSLGVLRELELTCDFEAVVTWVLGVASPNRYRVLELREPARLVVDVKHVN